MPRRSGRGDNQASPPSRSLRAIRAAVLIIPRRGRERGHGTAWAPAATAGNSGALPAAWVVHSTDDGRSILPGHGGRVMTTRTTRRGFIRGVAAASAALPVARRAPAAFAASGGKPALLGGTPVHSGGWPRWP